jgi:hypothetical protein
VKRSHLFAVAATVPSLAALSAPWLASGATPAPSSGLRGHVLYGPTCPVQRPGQNCTRPYQATIRILREPGGRLIATVRSRADGSFRVSLVPGRYLVRPQAGRPLPRSAPQIATVYSHRFTSVTVRYDSGIR